MVCDDLREFATDYALPLTALSPSFTASHCPSTVFHCLFTTLSLSSSAFHCPFKTALSLPFHRLSISFHHISLPFTAVLCERCAASAGVRSGAAVGLVVSAVRADRRRRVLRRRACVQRAQTREGRDALPFADLSSTAFR